jgi:hypothetical protein
MVSLALAKRFQRSLQRRMPKEWKITTKFERHGDHHQLIHYKITAHEVVFTIGAGGECQPPAGWVVQHMSGSFMSKTTITAPDGTRVTIDDGCLA